MVKRYAITMEESFRKSKPKVHVSPSRQRRANAPNTHDLRKNVDNNNLRSGTAQQQWMSSLFSLMFLFSRTAAFPSK